jgi:hypothetical protein
MKLAMRFVGLLLALYFPASAHAQQDPVQPVGQVALQQRGQLAESALLDVGIAIFDDGVPSDVSTHRELGIYPKVREVESRFLPVTLRQTLVASNAWGVVRVLPEASSLSEVWIEVRILESSGLRLRLFVTARDATGRVWLERDYLDESAEADYPIAPGSEPFANLYRSIANDLLATRESLAENQLRDIRRVAFLRYAASLSPEAFAGYLAEEAGQYSVQRLPAEGDDMIARVERIRNQEYLFVDNVDEQYISFKGEMAPAYDLWRQYDREQAIYRLEYQQRVANRDKQGRRGSFSAMQQTYNHYKVSKIQQQDIRDLALGFDNETAPTVVETSGKVFRLTGTLDSQYHEWQGILRQIFALETGLPVEE